MLRGILDDHPLRHALAAELHARPFEAIEAPGRVLFLALKHADETRARDRAADMAHLTALIDRHAGAHPDPDANHHTAELGRFRLKWERHTEFVSYTLIEARPAPAMFQDELAAHFPQDWLAEASGQVIAAIQIEVVSADGLDAAERVLSHDLMPAFTAESLACAQVLDGNALALGDFRIHESGFTRFALIIHGEAGRRRIGRTIQRLIEIEAYRTLAMLALPVARRTAGRLGEIEADLGSLIAEVDAGGPETEAEILRRLTALSAEIESMAAGSAFRFGAAGAYEAIVHQRIEMLREERMVGRQLFREFMVRRFDPAMRTCQAAERRLRDLAARAGRIAELLRTRVSVAVETQNQALLESMNRRAALQLRLQETVEGLSVVAISYYAVNLVSYLVAPMAERAGIEKGTVTALAVVPVVAVVFWLVRRMRRRIGEG